MPPGVLKNGDCDLRYDETAASMVSSLAARVIGSATIYKGDKTKKQRIDL